MTALHGAMLNILLPTASNPVRVLPPNRTNESKWRYAAFSVMSESGTTMLSAVAAFPTGPTSIGMTLATASAPTTSTSSRSIVLWSNVSADPTNPKSNVAWLGMVGTWGAVSGTTISVNR